MKKVYLVHGWGGSSEYFEPLIKELKGKAKVIALDLPDTDNPEIEKWVKFLEQKVNENEINSETWFIGHSIGCQTIMRYLEKINNKTGGIIFIAGWITLKGLSEEEKIIAKPWLNKKINFNKVKFNSKKILVILSDNDPYVPLSDAELFKRNLSAKIIIKKNLGHIDNILKINKEILNFLK